MCVGHRSLLYSRCSLSQHHVLSEPKQLVTCNGHVVLVPETLEGCGILISLSWQGYCVLSPARKVC